jgi:hypothetical protein
MTLRCTIEIVPYGNEANKSLICRLDISNIEQLRDEGFGHQICKYSVKLFRHNNPNMRQLMEEKEWELSAEGEIAEHDRRDGAVELVRKATFLMKDKL